MELSTTSREKQSFCGCIYQLQRKWCDTVALHNSCKQALPPSVYTNLLPANSVLTTFAFKYALKEYLLVLPKRPITKMYSYQNIHYQSVLYQNVWIPFVIVFEYRNVV